MTPLSSSVTAATPSAEAAEPDSSRPAVLIKQLPPGIAEPLAAAGFAAADCRFCARSDLDLDGNLRRTWLVVGTGSLTVCPEPAPEPAGIAVPLPPVALKKIEKTRVWQTVGSAVLQARVGGVYIDLIRFSNAHRELFARVRLQLERLLAGEVLQEDALTKPSELLCADCGLPLPARGSACLRCQAGRGILWRTLLLMKPYWALSLVLLALLGLRVGVNLVPPYLVRALVDRVLQPRERLDWLKYFVLLLLAVSVVGCVLNVIIGRLSSAVGARIGRELRENLQRKLLTLNVAYFDRHSAGSLMSRVLYDVDYFSGFVTQITEGFLLNLLMVLGIGVMLFTMNVELALMVLLPVPFVVLGTVIFWRHVYPRYYPFWESQSKMAQLLSGMLSGIRMVKAFAQEKRENERFSATAERMQEARDGLQRSVATFNPLMVLIFGIGGLIIWYSGGRLVVADTITLGTLMAFFTYVGMFYGPIHALSMFSNWATGFVSAGRRVFEILDSTSVIPEAAKTKPLPVVRGHIEFRKVVFGYDPHRPVLRNVSFSIEPGQFIGIVGKSGSGKTSLVNLICRFYDVQEGEVLIDGLDVRDLARADIRRHVGLVLQEPFLFRASIRDNIAYGSPGATEAEIIEAAKAANAHEFISRLASGYDTNVGERGAGLSGGERQRVTIARALVRQPPVLILDEATSSVDTESEQEIQRALAAVGRGRTTIVIAHRLSTLKNADRIFVVDNGRIAESGSHEELLSKNGIYARLVRIQTELTRLEV